MIGLCSIKNVKLKRTGDDVNNKLEASFNCLICCTKASEVKSGAHSKLLDSVYVTETVTN